MTFLKAAGTTAGTRVWGQQVPQRPTYPALIVTWIDAPRDYHLDGQADLVFGTVQIDCLAESLDAANTLADAVRMALSGYRGWMGETKITSVRVEDISDSIEAPPSGQQAGPWRAMLQITIGYKEAVPA